MPLPISLQQVYSPRCHPAAARWPLCLPVCRSLWSPSLAGGWVAAVCRWCPCRHTGTPGSEPLSTGACRDWEQTQASEPPSPLTQSSDITHGYIIFYTALHPGTLVSLRLPESTTGGTWWRVMFLITLALWDGIARLSQGLCWRPTDFQRWLERIIRNNFVLRHFNV